MVTFDFSRCKYCLYLRCISPDPTTTITAKDAFREGLYNSYTCWRCLHLPTLKRRAPRLTPVFVPGGNEIQRQHFIGYWRDDTRDSKRFLYLLEHEREIV